MSGGCSNVDIPIPETSDVANLIPLESLGLPQGTVEEVKRLVATRDCKGLNKIYRQVYRAEKKGQSTVSALPVLKTAFGTIGCEVSPPTGKPAKKNSKR